MTAKPQVSDEHFDATSQALSQITDEAIDHKADPQMTLHRASDKSHAHSFLQKYFPQSRLESIENSFHMGNYVIDRQTGKKSFEPMSIYVRVGMHVLYYGSEQERVLQWQRTLALLKAQSEKMGKEYDDPRSVDHIQPFIQSFQLQDSMKEMVQPDPTKYKTFNEFFSREIKPEARPPAQPQDVSGTPRFVERRASANVYASAIRRVIRGRFAYYCLPDNRSGHQILDQRLRLHTGQATPLRTFGARI